jgi:glycosyltransferase involved in cell wall biosynthesis
MRILIATSYRNVIGGVERYLQVVIPGLLKRGHEIALLYETALPESSEVIDPPGAALETWYWSDGSHHDTLASIAQWRPEMVYSQGLEDGELEGILLDTYPVALFAHNYFGTCVSGRKCHSFPTVRPCERRFGAACLALYYPRRCGGLSPSTMWRKYRRQSQINSRLPGYKKVLVASTHMAQEFQNHGVQSSQIHVVPLPANDGAGPDVAPSRNPQGRILFMGRLTDIKGAGNLVQAMALVSRRGLPLTLTIAGDGPELGRVQALAGALGVSLRCTGWIGSAEKLERLREADLLVIPSLWPEPFGMIGVEAGCHGVPAAGYAAGGIPDWLIPGVTGELAPANPPTPEGLAEAIMRALADPVHYQRLCQGAWEMSRKFTLERHLACLEPILADNNVDICAEAVSNQCARIW